MLRFYTVPIVNPSSVRRGWRALRSPPSERRFRGTLLTSCAWLAQGDDLQRHRSETGPGDLQLLCGGIGEVDDSPLVEYAAIVDAHHHRLLGVLIHQAHQRAEGQ